MFNCIIPSAKATIYGATHGGFSLNLALFGRELAFKDQGSNLWLSTNKIILFHQTLDLDPHLKWA